MAGGGDVLRRGLRLLAQTEVEIEKLTNTPKRRAGRIALARFRNLRIPTQPRPKRRIPNNGYRSVKVGHWLKDHLRRIKDMAEDAVCAAATGFRDYESPEDAVAAFNDHITPIAELYGFKLQMIIDGSGVGLRGDVNKALSVLTYLCSSQRTPEIDWLLDVVTMVMQDQPFHWKRTWYRKLRHTKRGKWWQGRRKLREQKEAIEAAKERRQQVERAALEEVIDGDANRGAFEGRHVELPNMSHQEGDHADQKRYANKRGYYPGALSTNVRMAKVRLPSDPHLNSLPNPDSDYWRRGRDLKKGKR
jgi:hypothetical protein